MWGVELRATVRVHGSTHNMPNDFGSPCQVFGGLAVLSPTKNFSAEQFKVTKNLNDTDLKSRAHIG